MVDVVCIPGARTHMVVFSFEMLKIAPIMSCDGCPNTSLVIQQLCLEMVESRKALKLKVDDGC